MDEDDIQDISEKWADLAAGPDVLALCAALLATRQAISLFLATWDDERVKSWLSSCAMHMHSHGYTYSGPSLDGPINALRGAIE